MNNGTGGRQAPITPNNDWVKPISKKPWVVVNPSQSHVDKPRSSCWKTLADLASNQLVELWLGDV